jgi:hypothetical protein
VQRNANFFEVKQDQKDKNVVLAVSSMVNELLRKRRQYRKRRVRVYNNRQLLCRLLPAKTNAIGEVTPVLRLFLGELTVRPASSLPAHRDSFIFSGGSLAKSYWHQTPF